MICVSKGSLAGAWHLQLDLAHARLQRPQVAAGAGIDPVGAALVALGPAGLIGLGVEQGVARLLDRVADQAVEVLVELGLVDLQDVAERLRLGDPACGGGISDPGEQVRGRRSFEE